MEYFQDVLSKEVYLSVYNRLKSVKNPWWVCIGEPKFVDGEFSIEPKFVLCRESNSLSALKKGVDLGTSLNKTIERTVNPAEYEWEENADSDLSEGHLLIGIVHITKKGDTILWKHIEPEKITQ